MSRIFISLTIVAAAFFQANAQYDPLHPPNTFRSKDNPYYWKNDPPYPSYWQQDVHYRIKANIDEKTDIIDGEEKLTYWNNSPDTLDHVFFHLYQNSFQPGSYYHMLNEAADNKVVFGDYEAQGLGTKIEDMKVNGKEAKMELNNTILKVHLPQPLLPGQSVDFDIKFKTYFDIGSMRRRMKMFNSWDYKHYDGVHWYPRISVYDWKFGWTTDQHTDKEFYGDFGTYDVELTFANNYIVEATGWLQNREEVLPDDLRQKLDIKNFANKPMFEPPSVIIPYDSTVRKTWHYYAENVHDFAFTADPTYRIGEDEWNGVQTIAVVQEPHAARWQNAASYTAKIIKTHSEAIGMYTYPKMVVADARDGMEYPMLTLDSGWDPGYRGLLVHEIAHNWFFGMLGTNETYRAAMDEGFTQFMTAHGLEVIDGDTMVTAPYQNSYLRKFKKPLLARDYRVYYGYLSDAVKAEDAVLATHSVDFGSGIRHGGGYRHVYYKMGAMLYNLQYVLGDDLFWGTMQYYFEKWKMKHPYFEDFKVAVREYTKADLNWFWDQWWMTTKNIDYAIEDIDKGDAPDEYILKFERKGDMQMPLDIRVIAKDGQVHDFYIPNTWFEKETDATVLPMWYGFGELQREYEAKVTVPGGLKKVIIDPSGRMADVYMPDNEKERALIGLPPMEVSFDAEVFNLPNRRKYELRWRPDIWYNAYDGLKAGLHLEGDYMRYKHQFSFTAWYSTGFLQGGIDGYDFGALEDDYDRFSYIFSYENGIHKFIPASKIRLSARQLAGLDALEGWFFKDVGERNTVRAGFKSMARFEDHYRLYPLYPDAWQRNMYNNTINLGMEHRYKYISGRGNIDLLLRSTSLWSDYDYAYAELNVINHTRLGKFLLRTRTFGRYGTGDNLAGESALYLAGANPEQLMDNKFTRAKGFIPTDWVGYGATTNHFHHGGGLNLRGYAGYAAIDASGESIYVGESGAAVNAELEFDNLVRFQPRFLRKFSLDTYLFGDAGSMLYRDGNNERNFSSIRVDGGLGLALTVKQFWVLETVKPLTIRFDMPLYLSHIPAAECVDCGENPSFGEAFQFRWVLGIDRAF